MVVAMTTINVSAVVALPVEETERRLRSYLRERAQSDGSVPLPLRMPLGRRRGDLALERAVVAHGDWNSDAESLDRPLAISWAPSGGGPFPRFDGLLSIEAEPDRRTSRLTIDGRYDPPGGPLGRTFDLLVGSRIARASLAGLIDGIARALSPVTSSPSRR